MWAITVCCSEIGFGHLPLCCKVIKPSEKLPLSGCTPTPGSCHRQISRLKERNTLPKLAADPLAFCLVELRDSWSPLLHSRPNPSRYPVARTVDCASRTDTKGFDLQSIGWLGTFAKDWLLHNPLLLFIAFMLYCTIGSGKLNSIQQSNPQYDNLRFALKYISCRLP